jgi:hypothetical protein
MGWVGHREALMLQPTERFRPARADWFQACGIAAALFALYALTSPRTVALEDDGLFTLSSYFLGIEHPPGYPLFTLIGHLFTKLPFGSVAYRVHLASALFGGLSCAAAWLCARALIPGRLPAYLAAFGLGLSPVFWSQSIIAEVYSLNTFMFLSLVFLGLRACPPAAQPIEGVAARRILYWMAFLFGLSLSNHWPLMLLVAPAFVVLLWPVRAELVRRLPALLGLVALGLLPYVWLVFRSWYFLPISFYGPLETLPEIWFFLSRAGYAEIDASVSASWLDRIKFLEFMTSQLFVQFAVAGTLLAGAGFVAQWRVLGRRIAWFMLVAFLMPSAVLLLLLGFDYSAATKHTFHVYPLPAYAICALWLGLGLVWLERRYALRERHAKAIGAAVVALIFFAGARSNLAPHHDWPAHYAQVLLKTLPRNAVVFVTGDADLSPLAYFHMIEGQRPDITLYHAQGMVLGNRLSSPLRTNKETARNIVRDMVIAQTDPVVFTFSAPVASAQIDRWLYVQVDKSPTARGKVTVDIPEEAVRFFEDFVAIPAEHNDWLATLQGELRRRYGMLLAQSLPRNRPPDERTRRHLDLLGKDFFGALGLAEGLIANEAGAPVGAVAGYLDKARDLMPSDVPKPQRARYFYLRGALRADLRDRAGTISDFETAIDVWPAPENPALKPLEDLYRETGNEPALAALRARIKRMASAIKG